MGVVNTAYFTHVSHMHEESCMITVTVAMPLGEFQPHIIKTTMSIMYNDLLLQLSAIFNRSIIKELMIMIMRPQVINY